MLIFSDLVIISTNFFFPSRYFRHAGSSLIILSKNLAQYININRFVVNVINRFSFGYKCRYKLSSYENEFVRLIYAFHYPVNKSVAFLFTFICSASLKTYAHDDVSVGSWMMGIQATYIDDNRLCCGSIRQGKFTPCFVLFL